MFSFVKKVSEYDQEVPHSETADKLCHFSTEKCLFKKISNIVDTGQHSFYTIFMRSFRIWTKRWTSHLFENPRGLAKRTVAVNLVFHEKGIS